MHHRFGEFKSKDSPSPSLPCQRFRNGVVSVTPPSPISFWSASFAIAALFSGSLFAADSFTRPFNADSVWNRPIPATATYENVPGLNQIAGGINFNDRWTTFVYSADSRSRKAKLFIHPASLWSQRQSGAVAERGNSAAIETTLRAASKPVNSFPANFYSTIVQSPPGERTFPVAVRDIQAHWREEISVPDHAFSPSPDTDGHLAIWQPDGKVLEVYGAVVCENGDVIGTMASFTDPEGDGSGLANGRCASLISNFAGLIRAGEVASGSIKHALAATFPPSLLTTETVYPAMAFDMTDRYSGTVPMGSLLAIPPSVDIAALKLSPGAEVIALAAQRYGIYIVDRGGEGLTLKADQNAADATTPQIRNELSKIVRELKRVRGFR